ncbi:Rz1 [Xylella phage Xfas53]|uniref:Rz1 n=1 Tax=Xylella phage Xfas53 TaxID=670252 RepID=UPI0001B60FE5|nr:Rz1 [Xylella phage Xfas53]ACV41128.1 Rz1 [Xylella phage Xfas53]
MRRSSKPKLMRCSFIASLLLPCVLGMSGCVRNGAVVCSPPPPVVLPPMPPMPTPEGVQTAQDVLLQPPPRTPQ